jgi:hypothetical protein
MKQETMLEGFDLISQLIDAGFSKGQAKIFHKLFDNHFARNDLVTKNDIIDIKNQINNLQQEIEKSELRMVIKLGSLLTIAIGLISTLKLFN